jgi:hypothetical protein
MSFLRAVIAAVVVFVVATSMVWATLNVSDYEWPRFALAAVPVPDHNRPRHVEYLAEAGRSDGEQTSLLKVLS